jgi:hypothetical protein
MLYTIEQVNRTAEELIIITKNKYSKEKSVSVIKRSSFESWLDRTGRLGIFCGLYYTDILAGVFNEPVVEPCTLNEYWLFGDCSVDIHTYLILQEAERSFYEIKEMMYSICNEYSQAI